MRILFGIVGLLGLAIAFIITLAAPTVAQQILASVVALGAVVLLAAAVVCSHLVELRTALEHTAQRLDAMHATQRGEDAAAAPPPLVTAADRAAQARRELL